MTSFEKMLLENGYNKFVLNCKTMKYEPTDNHIISTMVNLDHRYIHETDKVLLKKIEQGKRVTDDDFTWDDRKGVVCFGLNEANKPPTLIYPRPRINVKRELNFNGKKVVFYQDGRFDDSMNLVLSKEKPEEILKALFDLSIFFEYDLTIPSLSKQVNL